MKCNHFERSIGLDNCIRTSLSLLHFPLTSHLQWLVFINFVSLLGAIFWLKEQTVPGFFPKARKDDFVMYVLILI